MWLGLHSMKCFILFIIFRPFIHGLNTSTHNKQMRSASGRDFSPLRIHQPCVKLFFLSCTTSHEAPFDIMRFKWLPESARYHVASGQTDKALETLEKIAKDNGKPMLLGRLVVDDATTSSPHRGRFRDLLVPSLRRTSLLLWFIW
jgi:hypothetical protein